MTARTDTERPQPNDYPEEGPVPTAVQNVWNEAKVNGCICQMCADLGTECRNVCETEWDEQCGACLEGHHAADRKGRPTRRFVAEVERTAYPRGRWFGDAVSPKDRLLDMREALLSIQANAIDSNDECRYCRQDYEDGHLDWCPHLIATAAITASLPSKPKRIDWSDVVVDEGDEAP